MAINLTKLIFQRNIVINNNISQLILKSFNGKLINNGIRFVTIKVIKPCPERNEDHDEKNARLKRVQSPHLSIYKPQVTSMLSLSHRISGILMVAYSCAFGWGAILLPHDFSYYLEMFEDLELSAPTLCILKVPLVLPFVYHFMNGIRHLVMDAGKLYDLKEIYSSGLLIVMISVIITAGIVMS